MPNAVATAYAPDDPELPPARGVYEVESDDPSCVCWEIWSSDGRRLSRAYLHPSLVHAKTMLAFHAFLDAEDPIPARGRPALTLHRGGLMGSPV